MLYLSCYNLWLFNIHEQINSSRVKHGKRSITSRPGYPGTSSTLDTGHQPLSLWTTFFQISKTFQRRRLVFVLICFSMIQRSTFLINIFVNTNVGHVDIMY